MFPRLRRRTTDRAAIAGFLWLRTLVWLTPLRLLPVRRIRLSARDSQTFVEALIEAPAPNEALHAAAAEWRREQDRE